MEMEDLYMTEWDKKLEIFYTKQWKCICDQKNKMLEPIHLKIDKKQKFYSKTDKKFLYLRPTWKMYLVADIEDDQGRVMVYSPYLFGQGQLFLVPSDLIIRLGFN